MEKEKLISFIDTAKNVLKEFEHSLDWSCADEINYQYVDCPFDKRHKLLKKSYEAHIKMCKWRTLGYTQEEARELMYKQDNISNTKYPYINIDDIAAKVVPHISVPATHDKYVCSLTREERLQIYNQAREKMNNNERIKVDPALYEDLWMKRSNEDYSGSTKSELEIAKEQRDHKRRRQTYRAKNVHVTKRSQTEIIRAVLEVNMEHLRNLLNAHSRPPTPSCGNRSSSREAEDLKNDSVLVEVCDASLSQKDKKLSSKTTVYQNEASLASNFRARSRHSEKTVSSEVPGSEVSTASGQRMSHRRKRSPSCSDLGLSSRKSHKRSKDDRKDEKRKRYKPSKFNSDKSNNLYRKHTSKYKKS